MGVKKLRNKNKAGFTLIELLVVIAIIGLLASVVLLALNGARAKSRDAKRLADVRQIASALELYFNDRNTYPTTAAAQDPLPAAGIGQPNLVPNYIGLMPTAPSPSDCASASGQGGNGYYWLANGVGSSANLTTTFTMTFCLGAATGGYSAGPHTLTPAGIQ